MLTVKEIAIQLNTIGMSLIKDSSYTEDNYRVIIGKETFFSCKGGKALKKWFAEQKLDDEYKSIIKIHGKSARKEFEYYWC